LPLLKLCRSRRLRSEYTHIHSAILLSSIARLVGSSRIILAVAGLIDADQWYLFLQGKVPHDSIRAFAADVHL
jgi:hypothetical protein